MKLSELQKLITMYYNSDKPYLDQEVVIKVKPPFSTAGGTPFVKVKDIYDGFDWDSGRFFLIPEEPLAKTDADFEAKFKKLQEEHGWLYYENRNLKAENKKLRKMLEEKE